MKKVIVITLTEEMKQGLFNTSREAYQLWWLGVMKSEGYTVSEVHTAKQLTYYHDNCETIWSNHFEVTYTH